MKKNYFYISFLFLLLFGCSFQNETTYPPFLLADGNPSEVLINVFYETGFHKPETLEALNEVGQEHFLRKSNAERWEMKNKFEKILSQKKKEELRQLFKKLEMVDALYPQKENYDVVLILGATVPRMRQRIKSLEDYWRKGMRAKKIVFLTGDRPLTAPNETKAHLIDQNDSTIQFRPGWTAPETLPKTEAEGAQFAWNQVVSDNSLRNTDVEFISTPMIVNPETGETRRPNTADTVAQLLKEVDVKGNLLAISNNPYIAYQDLAVRKELLDHGVLNHISLETVGSKSSDAVTVDHYLDSLARILYMLTKIEKEGKLKGLGKA